MSRHTTPCGQVVKINKHHLRAHPDVLHMSQRDFEYLGQILLSTFVYPFILTVVMILFKKRFDAECEQEAHHYYMSARTMVSTLWSRVISPLLSRNEPIIEEQVKKQQGPKEPSIEDLHGEALEADASFNIGYNQIMFLCEFAQALQIQQAILNVYSRYWQISTCRNMTGLGARSALLANKDLVNRLLIAHQVEH